MIKIRYGGRMGDSLLKYAFAKILSDELDQYLPPHPIVGFPITYTEVNPTKKNSDQDEWMEIGGRKISNQLWNIEDIERQTLAKRNIHLRSNCMNYRNFRNYSDKIRNDWYCIKQPYDKNKLNFDGKFCVRKNVFTPIVVNNIARDDLVIHVRLGDLINSPDKSGRDAAKLLFFDYFDIILSNIKFGRVFITSDSIEHELLRPFDQYSPIYVFEPDHIKTLNLIRCFNRIAVSHSTYSWWAAYLSNAEEIYYPIVKQGAWMVTNRDSDCDIRVFDEDRYIYVSHKQSKIMGRFAEVTEW